MRNMYLILKILCEKNAKSKVNALTQKEIMDGIADKNESFCEKTVYNYLKKIIKAGMKYVNAMTYYISMEGIEFMKEMEAEEVE